MTKKIDAMEPFPRNRAKLLAAVMQSWRNVTQARILRLIESVRQKVRLIVAAGGGHTRYQIKVFV